MKVFDSIVISVVGTYSLVTERPDIFIVGVISGAILHIITSTIIRRVYGSFRR